MIMQNLQNELISFIVIALVVVLFAYYEFNPDYAIGKFQSKQTYYKI